MSAKTELRATILSALTNARETVETALGAIATETVRYERAVGVFEVQAGMALDNARAAFADAKAAGISFAKTPGIKTDDWREYARALVPGKSVQTLYRWQNAGAVAKILGDSVGTAVVGSLVPLYRVLTDAKTDEDREAAEGLIREEWSSLVQNAGTDENGRAIPPAEDAVKGAAERIAPSNRSGGADKRKTSKTDAKPQDETPKQDETQDETRRESSDSLVTVEAAKVEAATGPTDAILRGIMREHGGKPLTDAVVRGIMLATLRLANEHGIGAITAVIGTGAAPKADATK